MSSTNATRRRTGIRYWIAGGVVAALVATVAVIASGYEAQETPREEPGVWVTRASGQYGRVNTDTGEMDQVRKVDEPSGIVQSGALTAVLANGNGRAWPIDAANPVDLSDDATAESEDSGEAETAANVENASETDEPAAEAEGSAAVRMPEGTREVLTAGRFVGVRTEEGQVYAGTLREAELNQAAGDDSIADQATAEIESRLSALSRVDLTEPVEPEEVPEGEEPVENPGYLAQAIALTSDGQLAMYSASEQAVQVYDVSTGEAVGGPRSVPEDAGTDSVQLALIDDEWVMLNTTSGDLWREGEGAAIEVALDGDGVLQRSGASVEDAVLVADLGGLSEITSNGEVQRVLETTGTPARPTQVGERTYAAWIGQESGMLWDSVDGETPLEVDESAGELSEVDPQIRSNGSRAVLNELRSGMLWTLPDGTMIPLSQWSISDPPQDEQGKVIVEDVTEQVAPTAVDDTFGVRAGEVVSLPVLLNDFDANKRDVLTIVPESLGERAPPAGFGSVEMMPDGQALAIRMDDGATGSQTFSYQITDGVLASSSASVTLTVADDDENTAPQWCPVEGCQREWGVPEVTPGGTLVAQVLEGWVDPEGDVVTLAGVEVRRPDDPVRAVITADGRLAVRHSDPNTGAGEIALRITVRDGRGEEQTRDLTVGVDPGASPVYQDSATTLRTEQSSSVSPLQRVSGGSGSYQLVDATVQGTAATAAARSNTGKVDLAAVEEGTVTVSLTIQDNVTGNETTGLMRVTVTEDGAPFTIPPLRAFVRPLGDTIVEVLSTVPGASERPLFVETANVLDGELEADVIEHETIRVAGSTSDGSAGRIGAVNFTVGEGEARADGRLTVFQVPDAGSTGAIAVADTATVRAGQVVDIKVLNNDVAAPGERMLLHPDVIDSEAKGELAFASGNTLRYLAPTEPGTYRLSYTVYGASDPSVTDIGAVIVTVVPKGENRDPVPATLTARVSADAAVDVVVPLSGVDPDGDRVSLSGVAGAKLAGVTTSLRADGNAITLEASAETKPGATRIAYAVRDAYGGSGQGVINLIVTPRQDDPGPPILTTDSVRLTPDGDPATIRPLDNDVDPARGKLTITEVVPNVPDSDTEGAAELTSRIDVSKLKQGLVTVEPGEETGSVSYRYTVRSSESKSTSVGLIVVHTSERVGPQAPSVTDTVLNVRDRSAIASEGIDVVTNKVRWASGDVGSLKLSLWKPTATGYTVSGSRISGEYNPEGDTIVFKLTGMDASGVEVSSYGLLIVPPLDDLRLTVLSTASQTVDEEKSVTFDVHDVVAIADGDKLEVRQEGATVGRANASCTVDSAETLTYNAGKEAPWTDTCRFQARLEGQQRWTVIAVPINIVPKEPTVELTGLTRTISPGAGELINLIDMVTWPGGRAGDENRLQFSVSGGGGAFEVAPSGATVQADARADAVPGSVVTLTVTASGAGESTSTLTLRVGEAPSDLPKGATVPLQCTVGSSCQATVIGAAGEYDPFQGKSGGGLELVSVESGCAYGNFSVAGDGVAVSWPDDRGIGGTCTVGFAVKDAQNRQGTGSIEFDAQGVPRKPSIEQTGYDATSASFTVTLGAEAAHPDVSGVTLSGGGSGSCSAAGPSTYTCKATGLENGTKHQFSAKAVNSVGDSDPSNEVTAWAYKPPEQPTVNASAVEWSANEDPGSGKIDVVVSGSNDTASFQVLMDGSELGTITGDEGTLAAKIVPSGAHSIQAIPRTKFEVPSIGGGEATGAAGADEVTAIGAPRTGKITLSNEAGKAVVTYAVEDPDGADEIEVALCGTTSYGQSGSATCTRGATATASVRVSTAYGFGTGEASVENVGKPLPKLTFGAWNPENTPTAAADASSLTWAVGAAPLPTNATKTVIYSTGGSWSTTLPTASFTARQCYDTSDIDTCSPVSNTVTKPNPITISKKGSPSCYDVNNPITDLSTLLNGVVPGTAVTAPSIDVNSNVISLQVKPGGLDAGTIETCQKPETPPTPPPTPGP